MYTADLDHIHPSCPLSSSLRAPSHLLLSTSCLSGRTFKLPSPVSAAQVHMGVATQWDGEPPSGHSPKEKWWPLQGPSTAPQPRVGPLKPSPCLCGNF